MKELLEKMNQLELKYGSNDGIELEKLMTPEDWKEYCELTVEYIMITPSNRIKL